MNREKTRKYYASMKDDDLCQCDFCRNYYREIKAAYPRLAEYLAEFSIDIEKPLEVIPLEHGENGYASCIGVQYAVMGSPDDFAETEIDDLSIEIQDSHPPTDIDEAHFVIEVTAHQPIVLKWSV